MTQTLIDIDGVDLFHLGTSVLAVKFRPGLEDGWVSRNVGEQGSAFVETSNGRVFITMGDKEGMPWLVEWPCGYTEVVSAGRFEKYYGKGADEELEDVMAGEELQAREEYVAELLIDAEEYNENHIGSSDTGDGDELPPSDSDPKASV